MTTIEDQWQLAHWCEDMMPELSAHIRLSPNGEWLELRANPARNLCIMRARRKRIQNTDIIDFFCVEVLSAEVTGYICDQREVTRAILSKSGQLRSVSPSREIRPLACTPEFALCALAMVRHLGPDFPWVDCVRLFWEGIHAPNVVEF